MLKNCINIQSLLTMFAKSNCGNIPPAKLKEIRRDFER